MDVTALVVTWDSAADIGACLAALDAQDHDRFEIVVIDNASQDGTVAVVEAHLAAGTRHPTRLVRAGRNLGFCGAVNLGIGASTAGAVLLVNPDAEPAPDCTRRMVAVLADEPRCGSVQPKVLRRGRTTPDGHAVIDTTGHVLTRPRLVLNRGAGRPDDGRYDVPDEVFGVSGAIALHRRAMLDAVARQPAGTEAGTEAGTVEFLTEDLVAYFDDVELDLRARMQGWTARYEPAAVGVHARAGASRRRRRRVRSLNVANHLLVIVGTEPASTLLRDAFVVVPVWIVRLVVATVRAPIATAMAIGRLHLLPAALRRGREDRRRAVVPPAAVIDRWVTPLPDGWVRDALQRAAR